MINSKARVVYEAIFICQLHYFWQCEKEATGPLNRKKLLDYINDEALNTPDIQDAVPHVSGITRGKKVSSGYFFISMI